MQRSENNNMKEKAYQEFLKTAPSDHYSKEFIKFLANNNKVELKTKNWLVIRNVKYWTEKNNWVTAFYIGKDRINNVDAIAKMHELYAYFHEENHEWLVKAKMKRTVKLFHVHIYNKE